MTTNGSAFKGKPTITPSWFHADTEPLGKEKATISFLTTPQSRPLIVCPGPDPEFLAGGLDWIAPVYLRPESFQRLQAGFADGGVLQLGKFALGDFSLLKARDLAEGAGAGAAPEVT